MAEVAVEAEVSVAEVVAVVAAVVVPLVVLLSAHPAWAGCSSSKRKVVSKRYGLGGLGEVGGSPNGIDIPIVLLHPWGRRCRGHRSGPFLGQAPHMK